MIGIEHFLKNERPWCVLRMMLYSCHERICFSTQKKTERHAHHEDGFYFEVFPLIVHYYSEFVCSKRRSVTVNGG